jgi:hypothetical protein
MNMKKFVYKPRTAADIQQREKMSSNQEFDSVVASDIPVYKVKDGINKLRFLPPTWPDAKHFGFDIFVHYALGTEGKSSYTCAAKTKQEPCAICEQNAILAKEGGEVSNPVRRVATYVIDRDSESEDVQLYIMPPSLDKEICTLTLSTETGEVLLIDDPEEGYDVSFAREGSGLKTKYTGIRIARRSTPLGANGDDWLEFIVSRPVPSVINVYDSNHVKEALYSLNGFSKSPSKKGGLSWDKVHAMSLEQLTELIEDNNLTVDADQADNKADLADWICDELGIKQDKDPQASLQSMRASLSEKMNSIKSKVTD